MDRQRLTIVGPEAQAGSVAIVFAGCWHVAETNTCCVAASQHLPPNRFTSDGVAWQGKGRRRTSSLAGASPERDVEVLSDNEAAVLDPRWGMTIKPGPAACDAKRDFSDYHWATVVNHVVRSGRVRPFRKRWPTAQLTGCHPELGGRPACGLTPISESLFADQLGQPQKPNRACLLSDPCGP